MRAELLWWSVVKASQTIVVVEDDAALRRLVLVVLHGHGYRTLEAFDGHSGLTTFMRNRGDVDLVLTDVTMPHCGIEMAKKMLQEEPSLKIGFMSGAATRSSLPQSLRHVPVLEKPFTAARLCPFVRSCLETKHTQVYINGSEDKRRE